MVNFLLVQQSSYIKYPCFISLWDSRARNEHWVRKKWPERIKLTVNESNIINEPLVARKKNPSASFTYQIGVMKQIVKALPEAENCFNYICRFFPGMSNKKLKAGMFDGFQIRKFMNDTSFIASMNEKKSAAWISFSVVVSNFWETQKQRITFNWLKICFLNLKIWEQR